jgi:hypothetical protein
MSSNRNTALAIVVAAISLTAINASAAVAPESALATAIGKCSALPLSQRGICQELAVNRADGAMTAIPASAAEQQQVATANAHYADAMTACKRLPRSEINTCVDKAAGARAAMAPPLSGAQRAATRAESERYHAALVACVRLPLSQRSTCTSLHGNDERLSQRG